MSPLSAMAEAAEAFSARLRRAPGAATNALPHPAPHAPQLAWSNLLVSTPSLRRGHVELLSAPGRFAVLHVCLFPALGRAAPIFGFDMIAGPARVTGLFLDLSPVLPDMPGPRLRDAVAPGALDGFAEPRARPDWGGIFSADMLAVRPRSAGEIARGLSLARQALEAWLAALDGGARADPAAVADGQARYVAGQRANPHTARLLAGLIGDAPARRFIDKVLFPPVPAALSAPTLAEAENHPADGAARRGAHLSLTDRR